MTYLDGFWWPSGTEHYRQRYLHRFCDGQVLLDRLSRRCTCVQAGGHVGTWPIWLAPQFQYLHTFEPDALNRECLTRNVREWDRGNITIHAEALSAAPGRAGWKHATHNSGGHYVIPGGDTVTTVCIDQLKLPDCDAIFLDVEGSELRALKGAVNTLERCSPLLMLEWNNKGEKTGLSSREALGKWLAERGYREVAEIRSDKVFARK